MNIEFKKGDVVVFYKDEFTDDLYSTTIQMNTCLERASKLEVDYVGTDCISCIIPGQDISYNFHRDDLSLVNSKEETFSSLERDSNKFLKQQLEVYDYGGEYKVRITPKGLKIGCQNISKKDAVKLATRVLWAYGE